MKISRRKFLIISLMFGSGMTGIISYDSFSKKNNNNDKNINNYYEPESSIDNIYLKDLWIMPKSFK